MQVAEVKGKDVICTIKNSATLAGSLFTLHASQIHIDLPTLSEKDKEVISAFYIFGARKFRKRGGCSISRSGHATRM